MIIEEGLRDSVCVGVMVFVVLGVGVGDCVLVGELVEVASVVGEGV